ncbi:MAG: PAS domain S-box protein [Candidatus Melainabacteria bacterium]|nr:PAS domain S-box protein [Candidatus Melainabacteria bacterium]
MVPSGVDGTSPNLFQAVVDGLSDALTVVDANGCIIFWNNAACQLFGFTADEVLHRPLSIISSLDRDDGFRAIWHRLSSHEKVSAVQSTRLHKDGRSLPVTISYSPVFHPHGVLHSICLMFQTSTADTLEERFRLVVEAAPNGMILVDQAGEVVLVNSQVEKMFGYPQEELVGRPIEVLVPERYRAAHPGHRAGFAASPKVRMMGSGRELFALRKDGSEFPVEIGLNPITNSTGTFVLASVIDISERKRSEELVKSRDEALALSRLKSAFIANISHELRTPLSGIIGMNQLLRQMPLTIEQRELADSIADSAASLLTIVNDVLDLAKIESGKLTLNASPISVMSIVRDSARTLSEAARAKHLKLLTNIDYSIPDYLLGDPERIRQVLVNLLGNAVKFTPKGQVSVEAILENEESDLVQVRFTVRDTGIGIEKDKIEALFRPFSQLDDSPTRRYGGTGLGLSISKTIVETMDGEIGVDSEKGVGSTFWFVLPLRRMPGGTAAASEFVTLPPPAVAAPPPSPELTGRLVLVVEDSPLLRMMAQKQLEKLGVRSVSAATGLEAVELLRANSYDLILMDLNIPEIDGLEVTRQVRVMELPLAKHTPIIAMTAAAMKGDLDRCLEAGMDDYLPKPVLLEDLEAKLKQWLR